MALLANEELEGRVPKQVEVYTEDNSCNIGYYVDNDGRKRWGVIPNQKQKDINWNNDFGQYVNYGYRTTDTRFYTDIL